MKSISKLFNFDSGLQNNFFDILFMGTNHMLKHYQKTTQQKNYNFWFYCALNTNKNSDHVFKANNLDLSFVSNNYNITDFRMEW